MNCQLCGSDRPQLASAQIVPDFMLKYIQDEESGRAVMRVYDDESDQLLQVEEGGIEPDGELVCEACLATIGEWDRYADRLMYQDSGLVIEDMSVGDEESGTAEEAKVIRNVDYERFKLFQLSLLWRMGASDVIPFEPIDIGIHRQRLAEMLRSREPGAPEDFPCVMATIAPGGVHFVDFFDVRFWAERDVATTIELVSGGFVFRFFLGREVPKFTDRFALQQNGDLPLLQRHPGQLQGLMKLVGTEAAADDA